MRHDLVRRVRTNGRVRYYPNGLGTAPDLNRVFEQHWVFRDLRIRTLFALRRAEEARPVTIARALGISRQLASYHLRRLCESGYVEQSGGRYRVVPFLRGAPSRAGGGGSRSFLALDPVR